MITTEITLSLSLEVVGFIYDIKSLERAIQALSYNYFKFILKDTAILMAAILHFQLDFQDSCIY